MSKNTNENEISKKLEYIGLDLAKIPRFLKEKRKLEYRPLKIAEKKNYQVYKYIPISKIEILLTPYNRLNTIKEKYEKADSISTYLDSKSEENILKHTTFLKMLKEVEINKIEELEKEQKALQKKSPFLVKFKNNYLWQIYYSDITDTYFMLVPTEDLNYSAFFYLLKKQIELKKSKKEEYIYAPIVNEGYLATYLKATQITDLEKYIWQLTKKWPITYEVYDKDNSMTIQIVGKIAVYKQIESDYKINLKTEEEAEKFYQLLKALFILSSELPQYYQFTPKINAQGLLEFEYQNKKITYDKLMEVFIKDYERIRQTIGSLQQKQQTYEKELEDIKQDNMIKEQEYIAKERLIATYLECRKTFLGRVKYFFKSKKLKKNQKGEYNIEKVEISKEEKTIIEEVKFALKEYYTIEDIIQIVKYEDNILQTIKNLELDIIAQKRKIEALIKKIDNASLYLAEIDKHEKSIFEFWKFANKDEQALLQASQEEADSKNKLEKTFDYKDDYEEITRLIDKVQTKELKKEQTDVVFAATTHLLDVLNNIEDEEKMVKSLKQLKEVAQKDRILFNQENFDLFGSIREDNTKIQQLGEKKHRESKKDILKVLDITKNITLKEYKEKIKSIKEQLDAIMINASSPISIPIYCVLDEELEKQLQVFYLKPEEAIIAKEDNKQTNLYRLNIKEKMPIIYFTNSIYYNNDNKTLPNGMDISSKCLIDLKQYELQLVEKNNFRLVKVEEENKIATIKVNVYEYELRKRVNI